MRSHHGKTATAVGNENESDRRRGLGRAADEKHMARLLGVLLVAWTLGACHGRSEGTTPKPAPTKVESSASNGAEARGTESPGTDSQNPRPASRLPGSDADRSPSRPAGTAPGRPPARPAQGTQARATNTSGISIRILTKVSTGEKVTGLALGAPGLALATADKRIHLFDSTSGKEIWAADAVEQSLSTLAFAAAAPRLSAVGDQLSSYVWDLDQKKLFRTWHRKSGHAQALSADGSMLIRQDVRHSVRWFQLSTYKMKWLVKATLLGLSGDGTKVLCLTKRGNLEIRGAGRGRLVRKTRGWAGVEMAVADKTAGMAVAVAATGTDQARTWDLDLRCLSGKNTTGQRPKVRLSEKPLEMVVLWPVRLAVIRTAKSLVFIDLCSHRIIDTRTMALAAVGAFGDRLAVASDSGSVEIWQVGRSTQTCPLACGSDGRPAHGGAH